MEDERKEYAISKCEREVMDCKEYQELSKSMIEIEKRMKSILSGEALDLFIKYSDYSCRQELIYVEKLMRIIE